MRLDTLGRRVDSVDAAPFVRIVREVAARWETGLSSREHKGGIRSDGSRLPTGRLSQDIDESPLIGMSAACGVGEGLLGELRAGGGRRPTISFNTADKIVIGLLGPDQWHADPELASIIDAAVPVAA